MSCECGCGYIGEDDVAQWCAEEAAMFVVIAEENRDQAAAAGLSPGEEQRLRHEQLMGKTA